MFGSKFVPVATLDVMRQHVCRFTLDTDYTPETLMLLENAKGRRRAERSNGAAVSGTVYPELLRWLRGAELPVNAVPMPKPAEPEPSRLSYSRGGHNTAATLATDAYLLCIGAAVALLAVGKPDYALVLGVAGLLLRAGAVHMEGRS